MKTIRAAAFIFYSLLIVPYFSIGQDARKILEKSYRECMWLKGGSYKMTIAKKSFKDKALVVTQSTCRFLSTTSDSLSHWKFHVKMDNGDGALCTGNDLIMLRAGDSTGVIYSRNQSEYRTAIQNEGLFQPFFQPRVIFNFERLGESTVILRMSAEEKVLNSDCYVIRLIDLSRMTRPNSEKQEKVFYIDKQTFLPMGYSEINVARVGKDSLVKSEEFKLVQLDVDVAPHDSLFTYRQVPSWFELRTMLGSVYHHHLKTGIEAPVFEGKIAGGDSISLESLQGKKVMLYFFSRASYPSLKSLSAIQHFQDNNKDATVLLLCLERGEKSLIDLLKQRNITLKAIANAKAIADAYYITAAPAFIIIDQRGIIRNIETGFGEKTEGKLSMELRKE